MKNIFNIIAIVFVSSLGMAQSTTENYVKSTSYKVKTTDGQNKAGTTTALSNDDKIESITYFDGLGRAMQTISKQAGGNKEHIIMPIVYDSLGRTSRSYLPYPSTASGSTALNYIDNNATLIPNLETYYDLKYDEEWAANDVINPYSETHFEFSPLNRVLEQGAPGNDWQVDQNNDTDHTIKFKYQTNAIDEVELYSVIFPTLHTEEPQLVYEGFYGENELYKTITKDENWQPNQTYAASHTTEEFKNSLGQVVLKRTYDSNGVKHDTNYVYDDFGNLTYVLSPKGSDLIYYSPRFKSTTYQIDAIPFIPTTKGGAPITGGTGVVDVILDALARTIAIDFDLNFNSSIALKNGAIYLVGTGIPNMVVGTIANGNYTVSIQDGYLFIAGDGVINSLDDSISANLPAASINNSTLAELCYEYHYDKRNRLVEKKIPQKGWEYIVYDNLDRPVLTQDELQRTKWPKEWLVTKYDQFDRVAYTGIFNSSISRLSLQANMNNKTQHSVERSSSASTIDNVSVFYSDNIYPALNSKLHTVNYYDTYNATLSTAVPNPGTVYGKTISNDTKSLPTGSLVRVLGTGDWITSVSYYDDKGQPIYIGSKNYYLNTTDIIKTDLDFLGLVIESESSHTKDTNTAIIVTDRFTYDHANRLLTQKQQITGEPEELIVKNEYDELGQLKVKNVGNSEASPLQSVDYDYNIRGWLKQINNAEAIGNDLFSFKINYNTTNLGMGNDALFNGNISETMWKTANDPTSTTRGYAYDYDALNRITSGNMAINAGSGYTQAAGYHVNGLLYDKNGNIKSLKRTGETTIFDDLIYKYDGNQLVYVKDGITNQQTEGFIDGNITGTDYIYDANGNMIEDKNKKITSISYNHLNLPTEVEFNNSNAEKINYIYDATGLKLKKVVNNKGNITNTEYAGNYIYENSTLKFFSQPEGYVEPNGVSYEYIYQYKDHLGNIRLSYSDPNNSYQDILDSDLTNSYDGWVHSGNVTSEFINGSLKISVDSSWEGIKNVLPNLTVTAGQVVDINLTFDKDNTQSNVRLYFQELDANGNHLSWNTMDSDLQTGTHNYTYTVNSGTRLTLRIDKDNTNTSNLTSFYVDHVSVTTGALEIVEENNYYPFGLKHKGYNNVINGTDHPYGFGGKEEQNELGLGWIDITARNYNPELGRWMNIDPLADLFVNYSPYNYAYNNPINVVDLDGKSGDPVLSKLVQEAIINSAKSNILRILNGAYTNVIGGSSGIKEPVLANLPSGEDKYTYKESLLSGIMNDNNIKFNGTIKLSGQEFNYVGKGIKILGDSYFNVDDVNILGDNKYKRYTSYNSGFDGGYIVELNGGSTTLLRLYFPDSQTHEALSSTMKASQEAIWDELASKYPELKELLDLNNLLHRIIQIRGNYKKYKIPFDENSDEGKYFLGLMKDYSERKSKLLKKFEGNSWDDTVDNILNYLNN